jgi:hypothetical protein
VTIEIIAASFRSVRGYTLIAEIEVPATTTPSAWVRF